MQTLIILSALALLYLMHNSYRQPKSKQNKPKTPSFSVFRFFSFSGFSLITLLLVSLAYFSRPTSVELNSQAAISTPEFEAKTKLDKDPSTTTIDVNKNFVHEGHIYKLIKVAGYKGNDLSHLKTIEVKDAVYYMVPKGKLKEQASQDSKSMA